MRYETILFDLDGTLTDPAEGITQAVSYATTVLGYDPMPRETLLKFIGPPLLTAFREICDMPPEKAEFALGLFRAYYTECGIHENRLLPDARKLLTRLRAAGLRVVLATSKPEEQAHTVLSDFGITDCFDLVAGSTNDQTRSAKADVIAYALSSLGSPDPTTCLMVGDRSYDILGARACGMDAVGVLCGYGSVEELTEAGAICVLPTLSAVGDFLLGTEAAE